MSLVHTVELPSWESCILTTKYTVRKDIYEVVVGKYKLEKNQALQEQKSILKIQEVQGLIEEQCKKFPTASNFDYRMLINSDGSMDEDKLQGFFNPELLKLIH